MLGQDLFDIEGKSLKEVEDNWTSFRNDLIILSTYHNDYNVDEALGVIKFLTPYIINSKVFRELEEKHNISCIQQLYETRDFLIRKSDEQLLGMIKSGNSTWLENKLKRQDEDKKEKTC